MTPRSFNVYETDPARNRRVVSKRPFVRSKDLRSAGRNAANCITAVNTSRLKLVNKVDLTSDWEVFKVHVIEND